MKGSPPVQRSLIQYKHIMISTPKWYKERIKLGKEAESGIVWAWLGMYTDTSINRTVKKTCTSRKIMKAQLPYFHSQHSFLRTFLR